MKVATLKQLASSIMSTTSLVEVVELLRDFCENRADGRDWRRYSLKLLSFLEGPNNGTTKTPFEIITLKGNSKLPFASFSTIAIFSCPGRGPCEDWCYSVKSWRYPAAFFRQLQNSIFMKYLPDLVVKAFESIPSSVSKLRLYVDGDFSSVNDVLFWFNLIANRPSIKVYGYSKSWDEIHSATKLISVPSNYILNISGGGKVREVSKETMLNLPMVRGEFIAVPLSTVKDKSNKRFSLPEYHSETRASGLATTGRKVFSCPGLCGTCSNGDHACGSDKFRGIPIAIGIH